ncbi:MAG: hypothetical protein PUE49_03825 [Eggerthellales bacterium]|nr:hypothetical protein [Eggerthellales bacterium]
MPTFTKERLDQIESKMLEFMHFVADRNGGGLPSCFQPCGRILNNIQICKEHDYANMEELTYVVQSDWYATQDPLRGLNSFTVPCDSLQERVEFNNTYANYIKDLEVLIK